MDYLLVGNDPAVDFVNTEVVLDGTRTDLLQDFEDLTNWLAKARLAPAATLQQLGSRWKKTKEGEAALGGAQGLRDTLRSGFGKIAQTGRVPTAVADEISSWLRGLRMTSDIRVSDGRIHETTRPILERPEDAVSLLAQAAAKFLATADYSYIRHCEGEGCILFFYDTSKNHSRRWCSMELCGNRAKVAAFRQRA
jgi:predicted RNA-binding Zn ribbon-like protein